MDYLAEILDLGRHDARPRADLVYARQIMNFISYFFDDMFKREDEMPEERAFEAPSYPTAEAEQRAYRQAAQEAPQQNFEPARREQEAPRQRQEAPPTAAEERMDFDPTVCFLCGKKVSDGVVRYSQQQFGRTLCMKCQREQGGGQ